MARCLKDYSVFVSELVRLVPQTMADQGHPNVVSFLVCLRTFIIDGGWSGRLKKSYTNGNCSAILSDVLDQSICDFSPPRLVRDV
jgi:hypothetical protein